MTVQLTLFLVTQVIGYKLEFDDHSATWHFYHFVVDSLCYFVTFLKCTYRPYFQGCQIIDYIQCLFAYL